MLTCPLCKTEVPDQAPRCPRCQTDLSLLANFVTDLKTLLETADAHRRAGELAAAVETYLDVLDVDPANAEARAALGPVLRGIRAAERIDRPRERGLSAFQFVLLIATLLIAFALGFQICLQ